MSTNIRENMVRNFFKKLLKPTTAKVRRRDDTAMSASELAHRDSLGYHFGSAPAVGKRDPVAEPELPPSAKKAAAGHAEDKRKTQSFWKPDTRETHSTTALTVKARPTLVKTSSALVTTTRGSNTGEKLGSMQLGMHHHLPANIYGELQNRGSTVTHTTVNVTPPAKKGGRTFTPQEIAAHGEAFKGGALSSTKTDTHTARTKGHVMHPDGKKGFAYKAPSKNRSDIHRGLLDSINEEFDTLSTIRKVLNERNWESDPSTFHASRKGMFKKFKGPAGVAKLEARRARLKGHVHGHAGRVKMAQLNLAIRAKKHHGLRKGA